MRLRTGAFVFAGIALLSAAALRAAGQTPSYLYWMIDDTSYRSEYPIVTLNAVNAQGDEFYIDGYVVGSESIPVPVESEISDYASEEYRFFLGLYSESDTYGGRSREIGYGELEGSIGESPVPSAGKTRYSAWFATVPEPTSGMLALLGFAGLALRRGRT